MKTPARRVRALPEGDISFLDWEGSGPLIHFSHATGFNAETYKTILSPLADRFHIVASDLRGHGFSSLPAGPDIASDWRIYRDDLLRILEALHAPAILSGHSMGATVSLMAAAARPELVKGLVLFEPVMIPRAAQLARIIAEAFGRRMTNPLAEGAARRRDTFPSFEAALKAYTGRGAFKTWPAESLADYLHGGLLAAPGGEVVTLACRPAWEAQTFRMTPFGASGLTRRVKCPITLVYGTIHSTCRDSEVVNFERVGARIVKVDGASHFLPMERPEIVRAELARIATI